VKLLSIEINNYRSIKSISIPIEALTDETFTYGLIGVNEAGKSSILKALALKENVIKLSQKDFRDPKENVSVSFYYNVSVAEADAFREQLGKTDAELVNQLSNLSAMAAKYSFDSASLTKKTTYTVSRDDGSNLELPPDTVLSGRVHASIFWTAEDKYLISHPIELAAFASNPEDVSVPLRNCFLLANISNIKERIDQLAGDSTEIELLQTELGERVTEHIKTVWPGHPIKITFLITNGFINFHVKDINAKGKAKTADQRSDGFKQFVSFLLTISAQNKNEQLADALLLLDEPETHLHPQAQEYLLAEVKKISRNERNNVVIFATHSNFMIDKEDLSRNYRITKEDEGTVVARLSKSTSSYSGVNFEVFGIVSHDYHNELYAKLHSLYQLEDESAIDREKILSFDDGFFHQQHKQKKTKPWRSKTNAATLSTYVRNCINHADNGNTFTSDELLESIKFMRSLTIPTHALPAAAVAKPKI